MTRARLLLAAFLVFLPALLSAQLSFGRAETLTTSWAFHLGDDPGAREVDYDDSGWTRVTVPHDWSVKGQLNPELASATGYLPGGIGWYRNTFTLPANPPGGKLFLYFEGVYNRSEVYLNGQLLGRRPNGYVSFYYEATLPARFGEKNVLAVRVDHSRSADSRWYTGSGIYRPVHVIRSGPVHLSPWSLFVRTLSVTGEDAVLAVDSEIRNDSGTAASLTVTHRLRDADGTVVAEESMPAPVATDTTARVTASLAIGQVRLWSVDTPHLYALETVVADNGREVDRTVTRVGVRTFGFDPRLGFSLNGTSLKMKGVCLHHDAGVLGAAVPRVLWRQRLLALKKLGCNAIRTSHNPQATALYELCDELGLLVLDEAFDEWEFPKRKWLEGWNVGTPGFEGSYDFFGEWSERDLADMVRRDRNHPSVFAWSIGNEVDYPNDPYSHPVLDGATINQPMFGGYKPDQPDARRLGGIAQRLAAVVRAHDPSRPVTAALAGVVMSNETAYPSALDIVGYNYSENRYAADHATYPERVIFGSENGHGYHAWKAVVENDFVFGQFLWTGIDYLGESMPWPSRGFSSGLLDLAGGMKPRAFYRASLWLDTPVAYLGTEPLPRDEKPFLDAWPLWNYPTGTRIRAFAYSNAAVAELRLNGRLVGVRKRRDPESGLFWWDVDFEPGALEVIGLTDSGEPWARSEIRTHGAPARLVVASEQSVLERGEVAVIELRLEDEAGVRVMTSDTQVRCTIDGPAELLGLEAGNTRDMSDYTDAVHALHHGRIVAYVRARGDAGGVRVRFTAGSLPEAVLPLRVR